MSPDVQQAPSTGSSELPDSDYEDDSSDGWEEHGDVPGGGDVAVSPPASATSAVYVQDSSDVQLGPRTVYQAPVTINQHVTVSKNLPLELSGEALKQQHFATNGFVHHECRSTTLPEKERKGVTLPCRTQTLFWILLGVAVLLSAVAIITVYSLPSDTPVDPGLPRFLPTISPFDDADPNRTLPNGKKILSKNRWGGYEAKSAERLVHPTKYVVISHTAGIACFDSKTCSYYVRNIQDYHHSLPAYADIGYNFLVGGDGNVYEGRGWDVVSMHSGFVIRKNIGIAFIGNFVKDSPTYAQVESTTQLIDLGVKLGKLDTNYSVVAHNQTYNTISPGPNIYRIISNWSHFYVPSADDPA